MTESKSNSDLIENDSPAIAGFKRFSHQAMATTFEVVIIHDDEKYARQAAAAAFDQVNRLEAELSRFIENSDISRINNLPANKPLVLGLDAFNSLKLSRRIYIETNGAFDVTIGPLLDRRQNDQGRQQEIKQNIGTNLLKLDEDKHTVELSAGPVQVDLGGIGKGYAVDRMAELLREWSIDTTLISGGYSSVLALDAPPGTKGWPLSLSNPNNRKEILAKVLLHNRALGSSGLQKGRHIIDPRKNQPVGDKLAAWSSASDAATADALSTAFMIMSTDEIEEYCSSHPDVTAMIMLRETDKATQKNKILRFGPWNKAGLFT